MEKKQKKTPSKQDLAKLLLPKEKKTKKKEVNASTKKTKVGQKPPGAMEMFSLLFPTLDVRKPLDPNAPKLKIVDPKKIPYFQSKLRKPKIEFPAEARESIDEIRARRKARNCGASFASGGMDMKNLVCTPKKPPKDGVFQIRQPDGTPVVYVEYKGGKMHGVQKKFVNGSLSEIAHYKNGKHHGETRKYSGEVCVRKFTYKDGALNGPMVQYGKGGEPIMKTNFLNNKQHGITVVYTQGYMIARTSFVNGKKQGMMRAFYPPHAPDEPQRVSKETFYLNDLMEGPSHTYYPSGQVYMEENYLKNLRDGPCIEYFDTGKVRKLSVYKKNKLAKKPEEYDYYGKKVTS